MSNINMNKKQFRLLHACLFLKRAELIGKQGSIQTLDDVDKLYVEAKENRGLKQLYGYEGSPNQKYETQSLFDIMVAYLIKDYPQKYSVSSFIALSSLTRRLYINYKDFLLTDNINKTTITISKEYCGIYYHFLGISSLMDLNDCAVSHGLMSEKESVASSILFFKGYYYTEEEGRISTLLLKVENQKATVFLYRYKQNVRHLYQGKIVPLGNVLTFDLQSCELKEGTGVGKLSMLMRLGHNPLARLEYAEVSFATYCSLVSSDELSCGVIGFKACPNLTHEDNFDKWNSIVPDCFQYLLDQKDIIYQRKHETTRLQWKYNYTSFNDLELNEGENFKTYKKGRANIGQLAGVYKGYSLNTRIPNKSISISYCYLDLKGELVFKILDSRTRVVEEFVGHVKIYDNVYVFSLKGLNRKIKMLFEHRDEHSEVLYGVYVGVFRNQIAGGRILLKKYKNDKLNFSDLTPRRISLEDQDLKPMFKKESIYYKFFSGELTDEYIDDSDVIKYFEKSHTPLPIPMFNNNRFINYEGTYRLYFLYGDEQEIRSCPLSINEDGYVSVKSIWSKNTNEFYNGRSFMQQDKLYIHLYYNNWQNYQGTLIIQIAQEHKEYGFSEQNLQFTGTYSTGNYHGAIITGRIFLVQQSKDCGDFNTMETETHTCYAKPYRSLIVNGSEVDLRREFMGGHYNSIKLTQRINEELDSRKKSRYLWKKEVEEQDKAAYLRKHNYASIYFHSSIFSIEKGKEEYAKDLFWKALEHGWDEEFLDDYDREKYETYREVLKPVLQKFSRKYL